MFEDLDERMKHDALSETSRKERILRYIAISVASVLFFGGLIVAVRFVG
jgi:hypothetical protein